MAWLRRGVLVLPRCPEALQVVKGCCRGKGASLRRREVAQVRAMGRGAGKVCLRRRWKRDLATWNARGRGRCGRRRPRFPEAGG